MKPICSIEILIIITNRPQKTCKSKSDAIVSMKEKLGSTVKGLVKISNFI